MPKEKSNNVIDVNNDSINGIFQGFSSSNDIMSYSGSNTRIDITTDERNKQYITKKLHNNIKIKGNTKEDHTVDNNKIVIIGEWILFYPKIIILLMSDFIQVLQQKIL